MSGQVAQGAGLAGVGIYILAYGLLQAGLLRGTGYLYPALNLAAALLLLVSLSQTFNLAAALVQGCWVAISLFGLARRFLRDRRVRMTPEEEALVRAAFPRLSREQARRVLDVGFWRNIAPGTTLTQEGAPVTTLYHITHGQAEVEQGGVIVARLDHGFAGEIQALRQGPASATVRAREALRCFAMSGPALAALLARDTDLRAAVLDDLHRDTARKLTGASHDPQRA
ncbi:cyclic nucleotide-binding domain-containing protein [Meridianimarinicoccus sp. RP-17]|uniref:cyclic nucleotide-binding domain-containing protein n=1 Tax=Meridianimarinicoccus zhengii TaxID=2056810 RepID=UPI000DAE6363|nr:cyclic nucleotide-binding domain-containing protein [Phycocomes zhengii]